MWANLLVISLDIIIIIYNWSLKKLYIILSLNYLKFKQITPFSSIYKKNILFLGTLNN